MSADLLAIVEADEAARRDVESASARLAAQVDLERARIAAAAADADARAGREHEAALARIADEARDWAEARSAAREAERARRRARSAAVMSEAVAAYVRIVGEARASEGS